MSPSIIITKGLPITILLGLTEFDNSVNLNDGTWTYEVELRHKTERGPSVFPLTITPSVSSFTITITSQQTNTLDANDNDYVFVIKVSKIDQTVFLRNTVRASVINDL
jgi:hypothetical protein